MARDPSSSSCTCCPEAFDADMPYVEAYVSVEGAAELPADSDAYDDRVAGVVAAIEGIAPAREQARVDGLKAEARPIWTRRERNTKRGGPRED